MPNFSLVTVEGSTAGPTGSIALFHSRFPTTFSLEGNVYTKANVPDRVIPDFATKVPEALKGIVADPTRIPNMPAASGATSISSIASDGTMLRLEFVANGNYRVFRKLTGEALFSQIVNKQGSLVVQNATRPFLVTDNTGSWVAYLGGSLLLSGDNGITWKEVPLAVSIGTGSVIDLKWGTNGTLHMIARREVGDSNYYVYRSVDKGESWVKSATGPTSPNCIAYVSGSTWVVLNSGSTTTHTSTDDGVTWTTGTTLSFSLSASLTTNIIHNTNGRYYVLSGTTWYTGLSLNTMSSLGATFVGIGVDASGNCLALDTGGLFKYSANGAAVTSINHKTIKYNSANPVGYSFAFAAGTWIDNHGSYITTADLLAQKSFTAQANNCFNNFCATAASGRSIIALNSESFLQSDDNWNTWVLRKYDVATNTIAGFSLDLQIQGVATDNNGGWAVLIGGTNNVKVLVSSDNGATWVVRSVTMSTGTSVSISGGSLAGRYCIMGSNTVGRFTNDSFVNTTVTAQGGSARTYNMGYHAGFWYFITHNGGAEFHVNTVKESTGVCTFNLLGTDLSVGLGAQSYMFTYKNQAYAGGYFFIFNEAGGTILRDSTVGAVNNFFDGVLNGFTASAVLFQIGNKKGLAVTTLANTVSNIAFYTEGITGVTLGTNEYIKVS